MKTKIILSLLLFFKLSSYAQQKTNVKELEVFKKELIKKHTADSIALNTYFLNNKAPRSRETDSTYIMATGIDDFGQIIYTTTTNRDAAKTSNTQKLHQGGSLGLNLDGTGIVIGLWDGGAARATHQEFTNTGSSRITNSEVVATNAHATHVAGTLIASGVGAEAKGMAPNGSIKSYKFDNDLVEMTNEVLNNNLQLSNHSYGSVCGWNWNGTSWQWQNGLTTFLGQTEDYNFGYYSTAAQNYDNLSYNAPYYTMVWAAGNDNNDGPGTNSPYPNDGPYDCLPTAANAKNHILVGAVNDIPNGYTQPSDVVIASFSSTGPTDDGRIKPDLVANGVSLFSSHNQSDGHYSIASGTSMATPTITGSIALLNQHYKNVFGNTSKMTSATIKALLINTAEEAGATPGPDYIYGWGLMNTEKAVNKITAAKNQSITIKEQLLNNAQTYTIKAIVTATQPVKASVAWTDPAGTPITNVFDALDNPTKMLKNDLDFKITTENATIYYPWSLNGAIPANAATNTTKNNTDNVEGITAGNLPLGAVVTLTVDHVGSLINGAQWFSMVTDGLLSNDAFADAIPFIPSEYSGPLAFYTTKIGTADGGNYSCAAATPKNNVWFKFEALAAEQSIFVLSDGIYGTVQNPILSLWDSTGTTQIACHQSTAGNKAYLHLANLTIGTTYYVSVDNVNSNEAGSFTLYADASPIQSSTAGNATLEPGTIRYNNLLHKFQGWNGTQWLNFN